MHQQILSLMRCITHSNLQNPLLLNPLLTQLRYRYVKRPPPPLTPRDRNKENYWEAVMSYLDPSEEELIARPIEKTDKMELELNLSKLKYRKFQHRQKRVFHVGFDIDREPIKSEPIGIPPARIPIGRKSGAKYKDKPRRTVLSEAYETMDSGGFEERDKVTDKKIPPVDLPSNEEKPKEFEETADTSQTDPEVFEDEENVPVETQPKFLEVLRESNWMKMGDPRKKTFRGIVINRIGNQVYVDYGYKFHGVFKVPETMEPEQFGTGTKLLVLVKELELTQHFLGEDSLFSLLESEIQFQSLIE